MTKRDFFRLIIKLFGLYSFMLSLFTFLPQNISNILMFKEEIWMMLIILGSILLTSVFFLIFLFKTDFIIDILSLDKGFDDEKIILGEFKNEQIFKVSIILIGGFLIVDYFPTLLFELINIFKVQSSTNSILGHKVDNFNLIVGTINIIIGLFLVTNYKQLSRYMDKK